MDPICLPLEEAAVRAGDEVLTELDNNILLIVDNP
jgi:hypothetical protein